MPKGRVASGDSASLRLIPSVERLLSGAPFEPLIATFGRARVKEAVVRHLDRLRLARERFDEPRAVAEVEEALRAGTASTLRRIINGSGVIIHTNLGRSPIAPALWGRAGKIVEGYSNLEFDLETGERGARDEHLQSLCA